jgi:hypothetical protein
MIILALGAFVLIGVGLLRHSTSIRKRSERFTKNLRFARRNWPILLTILLAPLFLIFASFMTTTAVYVWIGFLAVTAFIITVRAFSCWPRERPTIGKRWTTPRGREFNPDATARERRARR